MNIFFYTANGSDSATHYLKRLQELPVLKKMMLLPGGSLFLSPLALTLRSGDLIILFVTNTEELDELVTLRNEFNDFRIILILADSEALPKAHSLHPSFVAFEDENMMKVEAVIQKIAASDMLLA
jgi:hypothetical protein